MENNIEKSFPFDSKLVNGKYDRGYVAEDFARYFKAFISSGMFMEKNTSLQVLANDDMTVTLQPGKMIIDGYRYDAEKDIIIQLSPADGLLNRIDRISITWIQEERDIHYTLQEGEYAYEPVAPECRRTAEYQDYVVADIYVAANRISITQSAITDQRLNSEVCGLAAPFMTVDTTLIFNQLQAFYQETVAHTAMWEHEEKSKIEEWFALIKDQLSEDAAIRLQLEVNNKLDKDGDSQNNSVTFVSEDTGDEDEASEYPKDWTYMPLLESGKSHSTLFNRIGTVFKNLRYLGKLLGGTDISSIGDGTVTGAIDVLNSKIEAINQSLPYRIVFNGTTMTITDEDRNVEV